MISCSCRRDTLYVWLSLGGIHPYPCYSVHICTYSALIYSFFLSFLYYYYLTGVGVVVECILYDVCVTSVVGVSVYLLLNVISRKICYALLISVISVLYTYIYSYL